MRIENLTSWNDVQGLDQASTEAVSKADAAAKRDTGVEDSAEFSSAVTLSSSLLQCLRTVPDIREAKVQNLREAVQGGTYSISSADIASAMLREFQQWTRR